MGKHSVDTRKITNEETDKLLKGTEKILDGARQLFKIKAATAEIDIALQSADRIYCFTVLQNELKNNKKLLQDSSFLTKLSLLELPMETVSTMAIEEVKKELKLIKTVIASKVIVKFGLQKIFEKLLKDITE